MRNVANRPRRNVASYDDYAEAERAVDYLSDQGFRSSAWRSSATACATSSRFKGA